MRYFALVGLLCVFLSGCGAAPFLATPTITPVPICRTTDGQTAYDKLYGIFGEWGDAVKLASSTPRVALAPQIGKMQDIRRKVQNEKWPTCALRSAAALQVSMDDTIDGFLAFLSQQDGNPKLSSAAIGLQLFQDEILKIKP